MKKIEVTVEIRSRYCEEIEITDEEYDALMRGEIDEYDIEELDFGDLYHRCRQDPWCEQDYVITDENGTEIVSWSNE